MDHEDNAFIMDWFRSHHGAPTDAKFPMLAKRAGVAVHEVAFVWWALLDFASQNDPRGSVTDFDPEALACFSGLDESKIKAIVGVCREKGMIDQDDMLSAWQRRQPKREDDSSERVRAFRERKKAETQGNAPVTQCNGRTEQSREEQNRQSEGADAPPRKTESPEPKKRPSRRCPPDFAVTDEMRVWASTECPGIDVNHESKAFRDYEFRNSHSDWLATWRNWMRKAHENRTKRNGSHGPETRRHKEFGQ